MGNPDSASLIRSSIDRQAMGSAVSTAMTTQLGLIARGAGRDFTGIEKETAAYPATATQKVGGQRAKEGERREGRTEKRKGKWKEWGASKPRGRCCTTGSPPDIGHISNFCLQGNASLTLWAMGGAGSPVPASLSSSVESHILSFQ